MIKGKQQLGSMATSKWGPLLTAHLEAFQLTSRFPKDKDQGALGGKLLHQHLQCSPLKILTFISLSPLMQLFL